MRLVSLWFHCVLEGADSLACYKVNEDLGMHFIVHYFTRNGHMHMKVL